MTCKHEWIKHPNNELLEMCRLCDKERTKGKESQKIPDIALSKGEIVTESCSTKKCWKRVFFSPSQNLCWCLGVCCVCWRRGVWGVQTQTA